MQMVIDFALSESSKKLNDVLIAMRKESEFELHDALARHENKLSDEQFGGDVAILDVDLMVKAVNMQMEASLRNTLNYPHIFTAYDGIDRFTDVVTRGFEKAAETLEKIKTADITELYVAVISKNGDTRITDTVSWSDILTEDELVKINAIYHKAQNEVLSICRQELLYITESFGKVAG